MTKKIEAIALDRVKSVYVGKNGRCCCGCAGKHYTREENEREFLNVIRTVNRAIREQHNVGDLLEDLGTCISLESPGRSTLRVVYFD